MRPYSPSIQAHLIAFGLALVLPVLALAGLVTDRYIASERARLEQETGDVAKGIGRRVDREIGHLEAVLNGLAQSASLQGQDWAAFHAQASRLGRTPDLYVILRRAGDGQQVVNTLRGPGAPLPLTGDPASDRRAIETGRPAVSDLFTGAVAGVPTVSVTVPVAPINGVTYTLTAAMQATAVAALITERPLAAGWTAGIADRRGVVIARSAEHDRVVGRPATPDFFQHAKGESGAWMGRNLLGVPALAAYSRSPETGWVTVVSVPEPVIMAPLRKSLWAISASGAALLLLAFGLAAWLGRRIAHPVRRLAEAAAALGEGRPVPEIRAPVREAREAGAALARTAATLRERDAALRRSEERYRALAESLPALVSLFEEGGGALMQNRRVEEYTGAPVPDQEAWSEVIHPDDRPAAAEARRAAAQEGAELQVDLRLRRRDGVHRWHHVRIAPVRLDGGGLCWLSTAVDVEDLKRAQVLQADLNAVLEQRVAEAAERLREETAVRRKAEDQLRRTQKMEAISRLTGGIAHDFNNKLMVISANIDAVIKQTKKQPQLTRKLLSALVAADRASALMSKLLAFARRQEFQPQYIDVAERLGSIAELLERSLLTDAISVELLADDDLWPLAVDPHQLETAILNLAVNARDAMPTGGTISIEAGNARVRAGEVPGLTAGEYVLITVHDTGTGIPADQVERVLEPFFTTKEPGTGTGLGLSMVYGFARQIGGTVVVDSSEGEGTSVSMYLPKAELDARVGPAGLEELMDDLPEEERRARVLLVDDDVDVAAAVEAMLTGLGYEVEVALGPEQALDHLKSAKPDLVITDVTMPGPMNGVLLGREIRERHPLLPVVLLTGNPGVITEPAEFPVVTKPVASHRLDTAIRQQLGSEEASGKVVRLFPGAGRSR